MGREKTAGASALTHEELSIGLQPSPLERSGDVSSASLHPEGVTLRREEHSSVSKGGWRQR